MKKIIESKKKENINYNWAECEYFETCNYAREGCDTKIQKQDCILWRAWKTMDWQNLFQENVDNYGNYLLNL